MRTKRTSSFVFVSQSCSSPKRAALPPTAASKDPSGGNLQRVDAFRFTEQSRRGRHTLPLLWLVDQDLAVPRHVELGAVV